MVKTHEALALALDALEKHYLEDAHSLQGKAITAIREALAEQTYPDNFIHALMYDVAKRDSEAAQQCRTDGRCQYAIDHGAEGMGHCPKGECVMSAQPEPDNTYNYAKNLAEAIFKKHFAGDEHYASGRIVWGVNDTVIGILTQINNMVADMVRRPAQRKPLTDEELQAIADKCRLYPRDFARAIEAAHGIK